MATLQHETSAQEPEEIYSDFKVRKETTISHYEVSNGKDSWWECLFYTENWGTFNSAVKRYCGLNCTPYKDKLKELVKLLESHDIKAELNYDSYRLMFNQINKSDIRVDYAIKNRGRSATPEESLS